MPIALLIEALNAIVALAPEVPQIVALATKVAGILETGAATPADEAELRAALDSAKAAIDAAAPDGATA